MEEKPVLRQLKFPARLCTVTAEIYNPRECKVANMDTCRFCGHLPRTAIMLNNTRSALPCTRQLRIGMKFFENRTGPSCFADLWS